MSILREMLNVWRVFESFTYFLTQQIAFTEYNEPINEDVLLWKDLSVHKVVKISLTSELFHTKCLRVFGVWIYYTIEILWLRRSKTMC